MTAIARECLRVVCETCGARRGHACRSVKRPPGMPSGMLPMWNLRTEVPPHRARLARATLFLIKRTQASGRQLVATTNGIRSRRLLARWTKRGVDGAPGNDFRFDFPNRPDGHFLHWLISHAKLDGGKTLREELDSRGYDITTLRIQVDLKPPPEDDVAKV